MGKIGKAAIVGSLLVAIAAMAIAAVAAVQVHRTQHKLDLADARITNLTAEGSARTSGGPIAELRDLFSGYQPDLDAMGPIVKAKPCQQRLVSHEYQQMVGQEAAGTDVGFYEQLLLSICPNAYR